MEYKLGSEFNECKRSLVDKGVCDRPYNRADIRSFVEDLKPDKLSPTELSSLIKSIDYVDTCELDSDTLQCLIDALEFDDMPITRMS